MTVNFKELVEEAMQERYDPRGRRCWPWSHEWSMWGLDVSARRQSRRCVGCGKLQINTLSSVCAHSWETFEQRDIRVPSQPNPIGVAYFQQCRWCGDSRRRDV
jgi:hypothetical protein